MLQVDLRRVGTPTVEVAAATYTVTATDGLLNQGTDKITVAGDTAMTTSGAGVISLNQLGGGTIDTGTYDLIDTTGTMGAADTDFILATPSLGGRDFSLQLDGTGKILQLTWVPLKIV